MASPAGARNLSRDRGLMALLETHGLTAFYGDFQALFGVDIALEPGETRRHHRRQRRRQVDAAALDRRRAAQRARRRPLRRRSRSARCPRRRCLSVGIAMVPEGRKLFPSLSVEENLLIGGYGAQGRRRLDARSGLRAVPDPQGAAQQSRHGALRRPAADGRDRPRADGQSRGAALRRDQPRPGAGRDPRHLRRLSAIRAGGRVDRHRRAGYRPGAEGRRPRLLHDGGPRHAVRPRRPSSAARPSTPPISERRHELARHHRPGRAARRALCAVRGGAQPRLRHHAAGQPRPWRPDRARRLSDPASSSRRSASIRSSPLLIAVPVMFALGWALQSSSSTARSARTSCRRCWSPSAFRSSSRTRCSKAFSADSRRISGRRAGDRLARSSARSMSA